jgi:hypothetical protein
MLRILALAVCLASTVVSAQTEQQYAERFLDKLCPEDVESVRLDATEAAVLAAVAVHFRSAQLPPEFLGRRDIIVADSDARHSVDVPGAPQVVFPRTVYYEPQFDLAVGQELRRHAVPADVAKELSDALRARNVLRRPLILPKAKGLVAMSCRDLMSSAWMRTKPPRGDWRNMASLISISLPAFDRSRGTALVLAVNSSEYALEFKIDDLELILLREAKPRGWQVEGHGTVKDYISRRIPRFQKEVPAGESVRADDYRIFDAALAQLASTRFVAGSCIALINQSDQVFPYVRPGLGELPSEFKTAGLNLEERSWAPAFIGEYTPPQNVRFVERETLNTFHPEREHGCRTTVRLSLPGYGPAGTAIVAYRLDRTTDTGNERGEGVTLLRRADQGWAIESESYRPTMWDTPKTATQ